MDRLIKFRAAHFNENNTFSHFSYWGFIGIDDKMSLGIFKGPSFSSGTFVKKNDQASAFTDQCGSILYEGDICKDRFGRVMYVQFENGKLQFRCDDPDNNFKWADMHQWLSRGPGNIKNVTKLRVTIVGNIYENPEYTELYT